MKTKKGFTLVELLVVIAIIGLLATIAFISLNSARSKARDAKRISDVRQVMSSLELYYADQNGYPTDGSAGLSPAVAWGTPLAVLTAPIMYIGIIPSVVTPVDGTCGTANNYYYESLDSAGATCDGAPCATYKIRFCLGNPTGGLAAGNKTATPSGITN